MKRIVSAVILFLFILSGMALAYDRGHVYIYGRVDAIYSDSIDISGVNYTIDTECKVIIQYKAKNAFHEKTARLSDIHRGDSVYAKKIGTVLYEIIIEGWKR